MKYFKFDFYLPTAKGNKFHRSIVKAFVSFEDADNFAQTFIGYHIEVTEIPVNYYNVFKATFK